MTFTFLGCEVPLIAERVSGMLTRDYQPDTVNLHCGGNDLANNRPTAQVVKQIDLLVILWLIKFHRVAVTRVYCRTSRWWTLILATWPAKKITKYNAVTPAQRCSNILRRTKFILIILGSISLLMSCLNSWQIFIGHYPSIRGRDHREWPTQ